MAPKPEKRKKKENADLETKRIKGDHQPSSEVVVDEKPLCKYGEKCYQKNPLHLKKFKHPHRETVVQPQSKTEDEKAESISDSDSSTSSSHSKNEEIPDMGSIKTSVENEVDDAQLPPSPTDVKENIKQKFLVEMPFDFYQFWEFAQSILSQNSTLEVFKESLGLELVGPFQLLNQSVENKSTEKFNSLTQWCFYYDPPEFQTVIIGDLSTGFHIGYFRDSPKEIPAFVGSNTESEGCIITPMGENLFSAISHFISVKQQKSDPFKKSQLASLRKKLEDWATNNKIPIEPQSHTLKKRKQKMVAKTFYECGIVVPIDKKTKVGYRKIPETDANIKKICKKILESPNLEEQNKNSDSLQELVTYVQYANDECDYGMGLELGLDLLAFGGEVFHPTILHLLEVAYELLEREEFGVLLKAHLKERRRLTRSVSE